MRIQNRYPCQTLCAVFGAISTGVSHSVYDIGEISEMLWMTLVCCFFFLSVEKLCSVEVV